VITVDCYRVLKFEASDDAYLAGGGPEAALVLHAVHDHAAQQLRPLQGQRLPVSVCHLHVTVLGLGLRLG